eukprot:CAMPEP_0179028904 /NCGR_PEP_ID=MMETSP0796-20121207/9780_1 /TAXON_ID=73915 /ORGANISM="Pyrodinium bahamense, Strain pbaha01" /LENGTH=232 /DNA_ID=CAMNT_0020725049 /DNA_START=143 /DNA_END=838 /DNA_ORIENTATION=-
MPTLEAILSFAFSPFVDLSKLPLQPEGQEESLETYRCAFKDSVRAILRTLPRIGSAELPAGLYLERQGLHKLFAPGEVAVPPTETANAGAVARTFERVSFETFDRHFLIEDTWREVHSTSWRAARTEFWCVAWRKSGGTDGLESAPTTRFRARVVLCTLQCGSREPLAMLMSPSSAHEFELTLEGASSVQLVGFDPGQVLQRFRGHVACPIPAVYGLRSPGNVRFVRIWEPI